MLSLKLLIITINLKYHCFEKQFVGYYYHQLLIYVSTEQWSRGVVEQWGREVEVEE
jgi:hypothetical protein